MDQSSIRHLTIHTLSLISCLFPQHLNFCTFGRKVRNNKEFSNEIKLNPLQFLFLWRISNASGSSFIAQCTVWLHVQEAQQQICYYTSAVAHNMGFRIQRIAFIHLTLRMVSLVLKVMLALVVSLWKAADICCPDMPVQQAAFWPLLHLDTREFD